MSLTRDVYYRKKYGGGNHFLQQTLDTLDVSDLMVKTRPFSNKHLQAGYVINAPN